MKYKGQKELYQFFEEHHISFQYYGHKEAGTIEQALEVWKGIEAAKCKNIFFRNHKGNQHYLVILEHTRQLDIHQLEKNLKQGKLTFASGKRLLHHLGVTPGSVSPFGLIHDKDKHVVVFIDKVLEEAERISFHPNDNRATVVVSNHDFKRFLNLCGNKFEYIELYT